jgi:predicted nucleic acid-binding protein
MRTRSSIEPEPSDLDKVADLLMAEMDAKSIEILDLKEKLRIANETAAVKEKQMLEILQSLREEVRLMNETLIANKKDETSFLVHNPDSKDVGLVSFLVDNGTSWLQYGEIVKSMSTDTHKKLKKVIIRSLADIKDFMKKSAVENSAMEKRLVKDSLMEESAVEKNVV